MTPDVLAVDAVAGALEGLAETAPVRANRVRIMTTPSRLREVVARTRDRLRCDHLVQIATADTGTVFELVYHLTGPHRVVLSVHVELPRAAPAVPSVHDLLPPAGIYERQIHDLFGIVFVGHPNLSRIILTEDWPADEYPLRKDWKRDPAKSYGAPPEGSA